MECLAIESPEDKADLIDSCKAKLQYVGKVQSVSGWAEFTHSDKPVGTQIMSGKDRPFLSF